MKKIIIIVSLSLTSFNLFADSIFGAGAGSCNPSLYTQTVSCTLKNNMSFKTDFIREICIKNVEKSLTNFEFQPEKNQKALDFEINTQITTPNLFVSSYQSEENYRHILVLCDGEISYDYGTCENPSKYDIEVFTDKKKTIHAKGLLNGEKVYSKSCSSKLKAL